jgi:hypothetical protein
MPWKKLATKDEICTGVDITKAKIEAHLHVLRGDDEFDTGVRELGVKHFLGLVEDDVAARTLGAATEDEEVVEIVELQVLGCSVAGGDCGNRVR